MSTSTMEILSTGWRAARAAAKQRRADRRARAHSGRLASAITEHGLAIAGLACFTTAAAMVAIPLALVVAGVSLFILELRAGE